jgi:hypothetical protein
MLGGREQDALPHQAGGVADAGNIVAMSLNRKIVKIHTAKDDTTVRRGGEETQVGIDSGVKANAFDFHWAVDGALKHKKI